jgi:hypothetical protein
MSSTIPGRNDADPRFRQGADCAEEGSASRPTLRGGQQDRLATRNHDGVLVVRGKTAIDGSLGPAVVAERDMARAGGGNNRFSDDSAT